MSVFESVVVLETVAVFAVGLLAPVCTVVTNCNVAVAPAGNVPIVQLGAVHVPTEGVALTNVSFESRTSFTTTFWASTVPVLVTVSV